MQTRSHITRSSTTLHLKRVIPALLLASCATIMNKDTSQLSVSSDPPGATFTTNVAGLSGSTPSIVSVPNGTTVQFTFALEGHDPISVESKPTRSSWIAGNILFGIIGGVIGVVVDVNNPKTMIHKKDINVAFAAPSIEATS